MTEYVFLFSDGSELKVMGDVVELGPGAIQVFKWEPQAQFVEAPKVKQFVIGVPYHNLHYWMVSE